MSTVLIIVIVLLAVIARIAPQLFFEILKAPFNLLPRAARRDLRGILKSLAIPIGLAVAVAAFLLFDSATGTQRIPVLIAWVPRLFGWGFFSLLMAALVGGAVWAGLESLDLSKDQPLPEPIPAPAIPHAELGPGPKMVEAPQAAPPAPIAQRRSASPIQIVVGALIFVVIFWFVIRG